MSSEEKKLLLQNIERLDNQQQMQVLEYVLTLIKAKQNREKLLSFAGSITPEDLDLMEKAIGDECENIDEDGWNLTL